MTKGTVKRVILVTAATAAGTVVRRINAYREAHRPPARTPDYRPHRHFEPKLWEDLRRQGFTVTTAGDGDVVATLTANAGPTESDILATLVP